MQTIINTNDPKPKPMILLKSERKLCKNIKNLTFLYEPAFSTETSIITIPINGKMKNTIPKIGVT
jgi:hypothetical protein